MPLMSMDQSEPSLNRTHSFKELAELHEGAAGSHRDQALVAGLYSNRFKVRTRSALTVTYSEGLYYACFDSIDLAGSSSPTIDIAREIPLGGCADRDVQIHEYTHHRIQISQQSRAFQAFFQLNPLPVKPFFAATQSEAQRLARDYIQAYGQALADSVYNFVQPAQTAFDSPEEYRRFSLLCAAELAPIARAAGITQRMGYAR